VATDAGADAGALRAEHDALAERLGTRASVDRMKEGGVLAFFSVIAFGMTCKLAWDRWGWLPVDKPPPPPGLPMYFLIAMLITAVLVGYSARAFLRAARLRREEAALYARFLALRARLGLDP
jgi:hypothetical protein